MANLPRFGRTWQRFSAFPRPGSASRAELRPLTATTDPEAVPSAPTTTDILRTSPIREGSVRKFPSPPSSPKHDGQPPSPPTLPRSEVRHEEEKKKSLYEKTESHQKQHQHQHQDQEVQSDGINMKGENVGAVMHITQSSDGQEIQKKRPGVGPSKENEEKAKKWSSNLPPKSFINTNFQSVNNSVMYTSSLTHRDPGLHLAFSNSPNHGHPLHHSSH